MEVDSEQRYQARQFIPYFDISSNFAWRDTRPEQIEQRRALLGDVLIFDLLLSSGGIKQPDAIYPPTDISALEHLLDAIEASHYDALKKECLVYYLLKWHHDGREERFQMERCIPPHFAAAADAYWLLDTGLNVPHAISILSDARINQEYTSKVLQAISLVPNSSPLIVKYVRTARPALTDPHDLETYIIALAETSGFCDAWEYQRIFNEASLMRSRLFKKLLDWTVMPKAKPAALEQLLFLPLSQYEESLLKSLALESSLPPHSTAVLQDLVCIRLVQAGRYIDAIKTDREFAASTSSKLKGMTTERSKMIQDLYSILPAAERVLLDEELKHADKQQPPSCENLTNNKSGGDISMSSSWEDVQALPSPPPSHKLGNLKSLRRDSQPLARSLGERVQAPRVGGAVPHKSLAEKQPPLIATPILNVSPSAPRPNLRQSFPLPFMPSAGIAPKPSGRPRHSAGHLLPSSTLESPKPFPLPFVSQKPSPEPVVAINGASEAPAFSSANKSKNAFFEPSARSNGLVGHTRSGNAMEESDETQPKRHPNENTNTEMADDHGQHVTMDETAPELEFSIFGNNGSPQHTPTAASNGLYSSAAEHGQKRKAVPPGAFLSDEDEIEGEQEDAPWGESVVSSVASRSPISPVNANAQQPSPEKRTTRSRHSVPREVQQLKRSLPGALMDEEDEEEDDYLAPLRQPSPRRPLRKGRPSTSSDAGDEPEAPQTRRRSSRLSSQINTAPVDISPKKSSASTKARKSTKSTSTAKRKR